MVDVVGAEAGPDQLLEEVRLLVRALGRAEAGDRARAVLAVDRPQAVGDEIKSLVPAGLPEMRKHLVVVDEAAWLAPPATLTAHVRGQRPLGVRILAADERRGQPLRRLRVVPAVAALHAQAAVGAGLLAALRERDRVPLSVDVVGERAADAAVGADRVHGVELRARADRHVPNGLVDERASGAGRHAFAAGHAGGLAHRVVQVEGDARRVALPGAADHVVALDVVASPDAAVAEDAGVVVDRDDGVRVVLPAA